MPVDRPRIERKEHSEYQQERDVRGENRHQERGLRVGQAVQLWGEELLHAPSAITLL
jgi:hypothetical protein